MTADVQQIHDDLRFVRQAMSRRERWMRGPVGIYWVWAVYVLVGYTLLDFRPEAGNWSLMIGGFVGAALSAWIGRRWSQRTGEIDWDYARRAWLHFSAIALAVFSSLALGAVNRELRGQVIGQVIVVMIGLIYFMAGVHFDRNFLWLGPVVIVGGILVGLAPHYAWTCLGAVIALGLTIPTLLPAQRGRSSNQPQQPAPKE